jgi:ketosteroid isomerase-like protein
MGIIDIFESFAADFEASVQDDDWSRLEKYLAEDATYLNVGGPEPQCNGRAAILAYLKEDVASFDRRFDTRTLVALTPPIADGNRLSRRWRCTYTLAGSPDLVVDGEARYLFADERIKEIEEEPTASSIQKVHEWIQKFGDRLPA